MLQRASDVGGSTDLSARLKSAGTALRNQGFDVFDIGMVPESALPFGVTAPARSEIGLEHVMAAESLARIGSDLTHGREGRYMMNPLSSVVFGHVEDSSKFILDVNQPMRGEPSRAYFIINTNSSVRKILEAYQAGDASLRKELWDQHPAVHLRNAFFHLDKGEVLEDAMQVAVDSAVNKAFDAMVDLSHGALKPELEPTW